MWSAKKGQNPHGVKYWETIADNLSKDGWSWGCVSAIDANERTIWIAGAHRDDGKRFVVYADDKPNAFQELESAIRANYPCRSWNIKNDLACRFLVLQGVTSYQSTQFPKHL